VTGINWDGKLYLTGVFFGYFNLNIVHICVTYKKDIGKGAKLKPGHTTQTTWQVSILVIEIQH
jgi:hypothetical protein